MAQGPAARVARGDREEIQAGIGGRHAASFDGGERDSDRRHRLNAMAPALDMRQRVQQRVRGGRAEWSSSCAASREQGISRRIACRTGRARAIAAWVSELRSLPRAIISAAA